MLEVQRRRRQAEEREQQQREEEERRVADQARTKQEQERSKKLDLVRNKLELKKNDVDDIRVYNNCILGTFRKQILELLVHASQRSFVWNSILAINTLLYTSA